MADYSAQGSITIKRLRTGSSILLTINKSKDLYQGVDATSGTVYPDWETEANQPTLTPVATCTRGQAVSLWGFKWYHDGEQLSFDPTSGLTGDGKFYRNPATGALTIKGNLASLNNKGNDVLRFECTATVSGSEYVITKEEVVQIQAVGSSSYVGRILATTEQLTADALTATLSTSLYLSSISVPTYYTKWFKDSVLLTATSGTAEITSATKSIAIGRSDIDGTQLFICEFYTDAARTQLVYRAGIRIIDSQDEHQIRFAYTNTNQATVYTEVDEGKTVEVTATVYNARTNTAVTLTGDITWSTSVMNKETWSPIRTVTTNIITISTADTDRNDKVYDVDVTSEVNWG